jgi:branched-chain amino acid transport system substrate-binding protein
MASLYNITGFSLKDEKKVIKIGWIGPLTGQSAVLGIDSVTAAEIAVKEINEAGGVNGKQLVLLVEDDEYNTQKTITAYNKFVHMDGVNIILMNTYGSVFALKEQAKRDNVIIIDPLDCNSELANLNDNIFCLATDSEDIARVLAKEADINSENVGIVYFNGDTFMPLIKDYFSEKIWW